MLRLHVDYKEPSAFNETIMYVKWISPPKTSSCPLSLAIQAYRLPPSGTTTNKQKPQYPPHADCQVNSRVLYSTVIPTNWFPVGQWAAGRLNNTDTSQNKDPAERKQQVCLVVCLAAGEYV